VTTAVVVATGSSAAEVVDVTAGWCPPPTRLCGNIRRRTWLNPLEALLPLDLNRSIPKARMARENPNTWELM